MVWPALEPRPRPRFTPVTTWVLTSGLQPDGLALFAVPSFCCADDPVPVALLTPTVTLVADIWQPRLASICCSVGEAWRMGKPPLSCAAAGSATNTVSAANSARNILRSLGEPG